MLSSNKASMGSLKDISVENTLGLAISSSLIAHWFFFFFLKIRKAINKIIEAWCKETLLGFSLRIVCIILISFKSDLQGGNNSIYDFDSGSKPA